MFHDIGNIGIPDQDPARKRSSLNAEDWKVSSEAHDDQRSICWNRCRRSRRRGAARVSPLPPDERWDGSGYPRRARRPGDRLRGADGFSVADALDAMTDRQAVPPAAAVGRLRSRGSARAPADQFEPGRGPRRPPRRLRAGSDRDRNRFLERSRTRSRGSIPDAADARRPPHPRRRGHGNVEAPLTR